ncbi:MAG TPA: ATP phosphoribosyltransferase [Nitrospinota bacterium]|nr:ATP phosphoribosyltransferase [Nitrospinota bacterium]
MKTIKLGVPKGSLNYPGRGNTEGLFIDAGYDIKGYSPTKEQDSSLVIANDLEISLFLTRPQSAPNELSRGLLDIAIIGGDWVMEESVNGEPLEKLCDLEYGKARLVTAIPKVTPAETLSEFFLIKSKEKKEIICYTEYINLTKSHFMKNDEYKKLYGNKVPLIQIRGIKGGENKSVQIINSDGVTEGYIAKGADIVVDNTQTGSTLKKYGLKELGEILISSAGLYGGKNLKEDPWKKDKALDIRDQLMGAVIARKYNDVKFNIHKKDFDKLMKYLKENKLYSQAPTVTEAGDWYAVNIVVLKETWPKISRELKRDYKASAIVRSNLRQFIL